MRMLWVVFNWSQMTIFDDISSISQANMMENHLPIDLCNSRCFIDARSFVVLPFF